MATGRGVDHDQVRVERLNRRKRDRRAEANRAVMRAGIPLGGRQRCIEVPLRHRRKLDVIEVVGKGEGAGLQRPGNQEQTVLLTQIRVRGRHSKRNAQMTETGSIVAIKQHPPASG
jgi:hypothetical protein